MAPVSINFGAQNCGAVPRPLSRTRVRPGWSKIIKIFQWALIFEQSVNHKRGPRSWPQIGAAATWLLCVVGVGLSPILSFWMAGTLGRFLRRKLRQRLETAPRSEGEQAARNPNGWPRPRVHTAYRSRDCDRRPRTILRGQAPGRNDITWPDFTFRLRDLHESVTGRRIVFFGLGYRAEPNYRGIP